MQKSLRIGRGRRKALLVCLLIGAALIAALVFFEKESAEPTREGAIFAFSRAYILRAEEAEICA